MNIKNYNPFAIVTILAFAIGFNSCKKFTEVEPVSQYSIPQAFSDASNATTALIGVYDELQGDNGYGIRLSMYYPYDTDEGGIATSSNKLLAVFL